MRILIAEDDAVSRRVLEATLRRWNHEVLVTHDGEEAWAEFQKPDPPRLAILDWMMPGLDGVEVCRRVREHPTAAGTYLILLTARGERSDIVAGFEAGADDYVTKPFDREELRARVRAGQRIVELQQSLSQRVQELEVAISHVKQLQGILPICCYCKKIRDDSNYWLQVEAYISKHSDARFSHGICPSCWEEVVRPELDELKRSQGTPEQGNLPG